jgi:hypothetical protein
MNRHVRLPGPLPDPLPSAPGVPSSASTRSTTSTAGLTLALFGGILAYAVAAHGGFYWREEASVAGALLLLAILGSRLEGADLFPLLALSCLTAGLLASGVRNGWPSGIGPSLAEVVVAGSAFCVTVTLIRAGLRDDLLRLISALGAVISLLGVLAVMFHATPWAGLATKEWRAGSTLTYANAFGALLILVLPAAALRVRRRHDAEAALIFAIALAGVFASGSRGAFLALMILIGGLRLLPGARAEGSRLLRSLARPAGAGAVIVVGLLPSMLGRGSPIPGLAAIGVGAVVATARIRWVATVLLLGLVATLVVIEWPSPRAPSKPGPAQRLSSRLDVSTDDRIENWRQALAAFSRAPLLGAGPGTLRIAYETNGHWVATPFAHNEFLQVLAETGVTGFAALLTGMWLLAWWTKRRRSIVGDTLAWKLAVTTLAAFSFQSFFDLVWRFPILVALAFVWLAIATSPPWAAEGRHAR